MKTFDLRRAVLPGVLALSVLAGSIPASAEPYIALRTGRPCSACHVNITGGGMRNAHGVAYGLDRMPWTPAAAPDDPTIFRGRLNDHVSIGSNLRASHASTFAPSGNTNEFAVSEGNLYGDLQLLKNRLHIYLDEHVAPGGASSREAFALLDGLPGRLYVKAGRFFPDYGWRLLDDTAFIRSVTGFNFRSADDGVELGWTPGKLASSLSVTNGSGGGAEQDENKQVTALTAWTSDHGRIGVSGSENRVQSENRRLAGVFAGVRMGPLVILGEADGVRSESVTGAPLPGSLDPKVRQMIGYAEADWLAHRGVNLKAAFDYFDPDRSQTGDEVNRVGAGVEFTPSPFTQFRILWRRTDRPGVVRGITYEDEREVLAELHLYL